MFYNYELTQWSNYSKINTAVFIQQVVFVQDIQSKFVIFSIY